MKAITNGSTDFVESSQINGFNSQVRFGGFNAKSDFERSFLELDSWSQPAFGNFYGDGDENERPSALKNYVLKADFDGVYNFDFSSNFTFDFMMEVTSILGAIDLTSFNINGYFQKNSQEKQTIISKSYTRAQLANPTNGS